MEYFSIDYMLPAEVSFPQELKRVAIVNNVPNAGKRPTARKPRNTPRDNAQATTDTDVFKGDGAIAAESLAESIADGNYFDEVVICDSALRANDTNIHPRPLNQAEVEHLVRQLDVDFLIAMEDVQVKTTYQTEFLPMYNIIAKTIDATVSPTVRIYIPGRQKPLLTLTPSDSIFWENQTVSDKELLEQTSLFAGTIPAKHLLPYWTSANRILFTGGSVNMRDATVYAHEQNWPEAIKLWQTVYDTKKGKSQMQVAYNIALGYEMQDSIAQAYEWAQKAQHIAYEVDKVDSKRTENGVDADLVPNYAMMTLYVGELGKRQEAMKRLQVQMQRFEE